jgi:EmrB/QacA subfamily drug resistance transporter
MASLDLSIVNIAFPSIEHSFPADPTSTLTWVITAYAIVFGALLVSAGRTADRVGRKRVFLVGLAVFSAGSALCGVAPDVALLVAGRVVEGAGAAALLPASLGLLLGAYPPERRSHIVALWSGVGALAVAAGPSLGASLVSLDNWRLVFYANLPVAGAAWLVGRRALHESAKSGGESSPDYPGVALITAALALAVLGISQGSSWGWLSAEILGSFAAAGLISALFIYRCAHADDPVLDLTLFSERTFSAANAATFLYAMGFFAMLLGNILFLTSVWHYSIIAAGLAITPSPLVVSVVAGPAGRLASRVGFRAVIGAGATLFAGGLVMFATLVGSNPMYLQRWLPITLIVGMGIGLTFPVLGAAAVSSLPIEHFAVGSAVNQTARQIGGAFGVAILAVILGSTPTSRASIADFRHLWFYCASMAAASGIVGQIVSPKPAQRTSRFELATPRARRRSPT